MAKIVIYPVAGNGSPQGSCCYKNVLWPNMHFDLKEHQYQHHGLNRVTLYFFFFWGGGGWFHGGVEWAWVGLPICSEVSRLAGNQSNRQTESLFSSSVIFISVMLCSRSFPSIPIPPWPNQAIGTECDLRSCVFIPSILSFTRSLVLLWWDCRSLKRSSDKA